MDVVATAGHVDHGKSTLVRALTGMEPDRWAEERRRGMTIDLGFVWTPAEGVGWLPEGRQIAFVDVPGHERFVRNMLAGVGAVPAVLLVVAADEGWMPQSEEHLRALDALGVRHGLVALSRADLADAEQLAAVRRAVGERLHRSTLRGAPVVAVSGRTGAGLDALRGELAALADRLPRADPDADVRLWVDRAFTRAGAGTVVTGTLAAGRLRVGDELELAPSGSRVRVRSLQALGRPCDEVGPVARVAVNLRGADPDAVGRGTALLTPGRWLGTDAADVRVPSERLPRSVVLHVGSAAVPAAVRPLGDTAARVSLSTALPLRPGDRVLLRDAGAHAVEGALVLDVRPPRLSRRGAAAARAAALAAMPDGPDVAGELRRRGVVAVSVLRAMGFDAASVDAVEGWAVDSALWAQLRERLAAEVARQAVEQPLGGGLAPEDLRRRLGLPDRRLVTALVAATDRVSLRDGRVVPAASDRTAGLPRELLAAVRSVAEALDAQPFRAPEAGELRELGLGARELAAAVRAGLLMRVADGVYLLPDAEQLAVDRLAALEQPFTVSDARQALETTRRVAVPLLEQLDRTGRTVRVDGAHRRVREVSR